MNTRSRSPHRYSVYPRYTAGSPALVDEATALIVAQEEREGYQRALTGVYGPAQEEKARELGLKGIVEHHTVHARHIVFADLLTGDTGILKDRVRTYQAPRPDLVLAPGATHWP